MSPTAAQLASFAAPPRYDAATAQAAQAAVEAACAQAVRTAAKLGRAGGAPSWDSLMAQLDEAAERVDRHYSLVAHLHAVAATPAWDKANRSCAAAVAAAYTKLGQHAGLYRRLVRLRGAARLEAGRRRLLDETIAGYRQAGVALSAARRKKFAANELRLAQLGAKFEENVRAATAGWSRPVAAARSFGDMPADLRAAARGRNGKWQVTLLDPSYLAYMTHGTDRRLRKQLACARNARASDLGPARLDNTRVLGEIVKLRFAQAALLGYDSPAAQILSRRMAKTPQQVARFIAKLAKAARPHARRELARLQQLAQAGWDIAEPQAWDMPFLAEQLRKKDTGLTDAQVRAYFGVARVLDGLLDCLGRLFAVRFARVQRPAWHPQVICLEVADARGAKLGELFLDLFARPEKRGGAWVHGALHRCTLPAGRQLPLALVNCNFTAAGRGADARLGWEEVVTLFHEAGHAMHHLLTKVEQYCGSGMNGVEWDAVELPSQFLENFAWRREVAGAMSAHEKTGRRLTDALYRKLCAQRNFLPGLFVTRQLALADFDLRLHSEPGADPIALWREVRAAHMVSPPLADERLPCTFGHIFAGGYAAGYYGYLWADVLAADAYQMFERRADLRRPGRRFAAEVLARGGTRSAQQNFFALRGRAARPDALLRRLGLN